MKQPATMHTGPLGSTFHILHAGPETVTGSGHFPNCSVIPGNPPTE